MNTMKKWLIIEICVLVVLLIVAVVTVVGISQGAFASGNLTVDRPETTNTVETTEETEETTEPPVTWATYPAERVLTAQQAFVYDCESGEFTYLLGDKTDRVYPASITKLFTAYVALQFLEPETQITAGSALELVGAGSSVAEIEAGDVLSVEMLVEAMLLPSGNDASYILADAAGRVISEDDSLSASAAVASFMKEVNGQLRAMGLSGTQFTNPDGYHSPDHYTTFRDLVVISEKVLENDTIMKYASTSKETVTLGERTLEWKNTNALIDPTSEYYCPYVTGLKTGQTPSAGSCLLSSFDVQGQQYIIGVFGCPEEEDRFADTLQLLNETLGIK